MLGNIFNRLFGPETGLAPELSGLDADIAMAALLVRVARADDHYTDDEAARIDAILARHYGLSAPEAAAHRREAEEIEANAPDTVRFTRQIKERIPLEDRAGVLAAMWEVALSDGVRTADEEQMLRLVAGLLGIPDRDSALIRQRVRAGLGPER